MAEQIRLRVPGKQTQPAVAESDLKLLPFLKAMVTTEVDVAFASRSAAAGIEPVEYQVDPDASVVELEFEGGIRQYVNPAQLRDDLRKRNLVSRSADAGDVVSVPTTTKLPACCGTSSTETSDDGPSTTNFGNCLRSS